VPTDAQVVNNATVREDDAHPMIYFVTFVACLILAEIYRQGGHRVMGSIWGACGFSHLYWFCKLRFVRFFRERG
jgi:hypothetical protein